MCRARWRRAAPACASDVRARARPRPQKNAKARELENWEKARAKLKGMCEPPPHERDLNEMSEGLLFIAELGKEDYLEEMTHRRFPVLLTEHFKNSVIVSNVLYCIGASALASFEKKLIPPPKVLRARTHCSRRQCTCTLSHAHVHAARSERMVCTGPRGSTLTPSSLCRSTPASR